MVPLEPDTCATIIANLKLPVFFFRGPRLVYTNDAADRLSARVRAEHAIDMTVILLDHMRRLATDAAGGHDAVVLLTAPSGKPFAVSVLTVEPATPSRPLAGTLVTVRESGIDGVAFNRHYRLSRREAQVAQLVLLGYSNQDVSDTLGVTLATTKKHLSRIFDKVGVDRRSQLISRLV